MLSKVYAQPAGLPKERYRGAIVGRLVLEALPAEDDA